MQYTYAAFLQDLNLLCKQQHLLNSKITLKERTNVLAYVANYKNFLVNEKKMHIKLVDLLLDNAAEVA